MFAPILTPTYFLPTASGAVALRGFRPSRRISTSSTASPKRYRSWKHTRAIFNDCWDKIRQKVGSSSAHFLQGVLSSTGLDGSAHWQLFFSPLLTLPSSRLFKKHYMGKFNLQTSILRHAKPHNVSINDPNNAIVLTQ